MKEIQNHLEGFSKHLMVTVFAIFAFASTSFYSVESIWVKGLYVLALLAAILSLSFGYRINVHLVNFMVENMNEPGQKAKKEFTIPALLVQKMTKELQKQYHASLLSLCLLLAAIVMRFFFV